ncbi:unnamed protein product [Prorocentrum cordatum]|uniref:Uncharacterized protein n=1 Tax=Prorocentrum cordatum TaxID=2364126 RepID=A0ABN9QR82_9DINO|nr:unnamed protein product [Polarella glacialis]
MGSGFKHFGQSDRCSAACPLCARPPRHLLGARAPMARAGSRGSPLLAVCALAALAGALLSCGRPFLAPPALRAQGARAGGPVAGQAAADAHQGPRTAMRFFGETPPPPKPKEKPFKLPPFFTTLASLAVVLGGCAYFLNNA